MSYVTWAASQQAFSRRVMFLLWSVYIDDSNIMDFRSAKGSGRQLGKKGFKLLGVVFAESKQLAIASCNDHLGVMTDLSLLADASFVRESPGHA